MNEDTLKCNIDVLVEGVEEVVLEEDDVEVLDDDERDVMVIKKKIKKLKYLLKKILKI